MKKGRADLRKAVKAAEQDALEMLVDLFDWLDGLKPQPTTEIVEEMQKTKTKITDLALSDGVAGHAVVSCSSHLHLALKTYPMGNRA